MNLYEFNKMGYNSIPPLTQEEEQKAIKLISQFINNKHNHYYMLLNHDTHYYTLFNWVSCSKNDFTKEILEILKSLGRIKSIELSLNQEMIEIWITDIMTNETYMYGFFPYDEGVITV